MKKPIVKYLIKRVGALIIVISPVTFIAMVAPTERYFQIAKNLDIFASVYKEVDKNYVDQLDPDELIRPGIDAMLGSLDPYTNFFDRDEAKEFRSATMGRYAGIGARILIIDKSPVIIRLYEGFAAHKAGLKVGDEILEVNGQSTKGKTTDEISALVKGVAGSEISILLKRYGLEENLELKFDRESIRIKNVDYFGVVDQVGYIKLSEFTPGAGKEVAQALRQLRSQGAKSIILDLRDNLGGLLSEAINVSNVFIPKNKEIVSTKARATSWNRTFKTLNKPTDTKTPLAVLINGQSASASEIVAGVIQDYDRGVLVGQRSFGKGLVQTTRPLTHNTQVKITTARYHIPSGRCIQSQNYNDSIIKSPDPIEASFSTANGRQVFGGGGINPDLEIAPKPLSKITTRLRSKALLFQFVTEYVSKLTVPPDLETYQFSLQDYKTFISWLNNKGFTYSSLINQEMKELENAAKKEKYHNQLKDEINRMKSHIVDHESIDWDKYYDEINPLMRDEVLSRFYLSDGKIRRSIREDKVILQASKLLSTPKDYRNLLKIQ